MEDDSFIFSGRYCNSKFSCSQNIEQVTDVLETKVTVDCRSYEEQSEDDEIIDDSSSGSGGVVFLLIIIAALIALLIVVLVVKVLCFNLNRREQPMSGKT
mmetsp:Transcript_1819/g.2439  ORF Transcript_1819/g.2439 Transcript_1819/m.2439 type:complete len:100 (-) Transcript_1819:161-460(-)|eukprot:CAMPEP_0170498256 /NCGR_PEP_ID=MMETSP0208-20121228/27285_1 /TAXON_ID=197538 /ORGANISM="Strombidium inclinatum, Strain S3" /LENGTH=99 /DNA_ID=CAMNT_0010775381 /DNA_START=165 /DNA_END=464 /DNA_ORIENTATION=+